MKRYVGAVREHFDEKFEVVKEGFKLINQRLDKHEVIFDSHTEMIGKVMLQLEEIRGEMRQKVDYTDFAKLEKRVVYLETRLARA